MVPRIDSWSGIIASILLVAFACGCGSVPGGSASGKTNVEIVIASRPAASSPAGGRNVLPRAVPDNVATVRVTVSAPDMTTMAQDVSAAPGDNSVLVSLDVPNGTNRLFVVEVFNAVGTLLYRGETPNVTLSGNPADGSPVSIDVQLAIVTLTFSQADLAGTWDYIFFIIGRYPGWERGTATIDGSGNVTVASGLRSDGSSTVQTGPIIETISSTGVVSESGSGGSATFHGQMSSNKQLVFGTKYESVDNTVTMRVFRKRTGTVSFTRTDLESKAFTFHGLRTGTDNNWNYGAGSTDASGLVTLTSEVGPAGPLTPGTSGTLSVTPAGIVTESNDNTFYGLMTDDKKVIFKIDGSVSDGSYGFHVIMVTGQTYAQSDYAGIYSWSVIRNGAPNPVWAYGVSSVDAAGTGTYLSYTDSGGGGPNPAIYTRVLSASGVVTDPADPTAHGQMSYNKDITVRTNTNPLSGRYGVVIGFKQ